MTKYWILWVQLASRFMQLSKQALFLADQWMAQIVSHFNPDNHNGRVNYTWCISSSGSYSLWTDSWCILCSHYTSISSPWHLAMINVRSVSITHGTLCCSLSIIGKQCLQYCNCSSHIGPSMTSWWSLYSLSCLLGYDLKTLGLWGLTLRFGFRSRRQIGGFSPLFSGLWWRHFRSFEGIQWRGIPWWDQTWSYSCLIGSTRFFPFGIV